MRNPTDITIQNEGSLYLFELHSEIARAWVADHVVGETTWVGGALVVERRYARDIAAGAVRDGLVVS
jgi:hypothetical protein